MTKQECIKKALEAAGWTRDLLARTKKYIVMTKNDRKMYLGSAGACRAGRTISDSIPCNAQLVQDLISKGADLIRAGKVTGLGKIRGEEPST